mmetsp:Transcript_11660/g.54308  ORF Transcript_11660/g.54308 Transcript_11660/m.54308 type:complete len:202 (-) Transcript_11660:3605-4210(-)
MPRRRRRLITPATAARRRRRTRMRTSGMMTSGMRTSGSIAAATTRVTSRRRRRTLSSVRLNASATTRFVPFTSSTRATRSSSPSAPRSPNNSRRTLAPITSTSWIPFGRFETRRMTYRSTTWRTWARRRCEPCAGRIQRRRGCSNRKLSDGTRGSGTNADGARCSGRWTSAICSCWTARRRRIRTTYANRCTSPGSRSCGA